MIGNAAAALQGSPVTTLDIDFMFQKTAGNLKKLKALARDSKRRSQNLLSVHRELM